MASALCTVGATWTTDAPFRETSVEIRKYASEGVLTVDMEAASIYAMAHFRGFAAASAFVISDTLSENGWKPGFHRKSLKSGLRRLFILAAKTLIKNA